MRFHWGAIPADPNFRPEAEGWHKLREPSPAVLILYGLLIGAVVLLVLIILWLWAGVDVIFPIRWTWANILSVPFVILAHELLHAVGYPDLGLSDKTIIGFWPGKFVAYAYHDAPLSRIRLLIVGIIPFLTLSLLPLGMFVLLGAPFLGEERTTHLFTLSLMNGLFSAGDILGEILVILQIPPLAMVRFHGWTTYWKSHDG
ncbi:MAG: hypothetical protein C4309_04240 [Chloroflexota bacterium]